MIAEGKAAFGLGDDRLRERDSVTRNSHREAKTKRKDGASAKHQSDALL
jgi:hypothetical protein